MQTDVAHPARTTDGADPAKRRQILVGAREVFLARGYDGASMDAIAKAAGVSKGTLYVYFDNKESLFAALILEERAALAENLVNFADEVSDLRTTLARIGRRYLDALAKPEHISSIRMVVGAVEKFPEAGHIFYASGPGTGIERLAALFEDLAARGLLRPGDQTVAAGHFMDLCASGLLRRLLFDVERQPGEERRDEIVAVAVDVFLRAYGTG